MKVIIVMFLVLATSARNVYAQNPVLSSTLAAMWKSGEADRVYQTGLNRVNRDPNDYVGLAIKANYEITFGKIKKHIETLKRILIVGDTINVPEFKYQWNNFSHDLIAGFIVGLGQEFPGVEEVESASPISTIGDNFSVDTTISIFERAGAIAPGWELDIPPALTAITPTSGSSRDAVTLTGTNFTGATAVRFGTRDADDFTVDSPTQITAHPPGVSNPWQNHRATPGGAAPGAASQSSGGLGPFTGKISVAIPAGTATSTADFSVVAPPDDLPGGGGETP